MTHPMNLTTEMPRLKDDVCSDEDVNLNGYPSSLAEEMGAASEVDLSKEMKGDEERTVADEEQLRRTSSCHILPGLGIKFQFGRRIPC